MKKSNVIDLRRPPAPDALRCPQVDVLNGWEARPPMAAGYYWILGGSFPKDPRLVQLTPNQLVREVGSLTRAPLDHYRSYAWNGPVAAPAIPEARA